MLDNKQTEREAIREMFVIKLRKIKEEKDRIAAMDVVSDNLEKSVEEGDVKTQGELSKSISDRKDLNDGNTGRQSKNPGGVSPNATAAANLNDQSTLDVPADKNLSKDESHMSLNQLPKRDNLDGDFKPVIIEVWRDLSGNYKRQMKRIFRNIRLQREQAGRQQAELKTQFLEFLHTSDGKQGILEEFVKSFNSFSDDYPDLREDD